MVECDDRNCPVHGNLKVRGMRKTGTIVSTKARKTAVIEMDIIKKFEKYKRWAHDKTRTVAHNPPCIDAQQGDIVKIGESRKISKTKAWVILEIIKKGGAQ